MLGEILERSRSSAAYSVNSANSNDSTCVSVYVCVCAREILLFQHNKRVVARMRVERNYARKQSFVDYSARESQTCSQPRNIAQMKAIQRRDSLGENS